MFGFHAFNIQDWFGDCKGFLEDFWNYFRGLGGYMAVGGGGWGGFGRPFRQLASIEASKRADIQVVVLPVASTTLMATYSPRLSSSRDDAHQGRVFSCAKMGAKA